jgi:carbamate kinase
MNYETMLKNINICTKQIAKLIMNGNSISISHGNGPQVGALVLQNQYCEKVSPMPLSVLGAQSQGEIG